MASQLAMICQTLLKVPENLRPICALEKRKAQPFSTKPLF